MSKTIKTVFDANPTSGNNPADEIYIPIDKGNGLAISYNSDQIANVVADRLGISGNIGTPSALVITLPDNTLTYNIAPITGITYTHYIVISNFTGTITYPSGFVQGSIPAQGVLSGFAPEIIRVAVYDTATSIQTPILDPNGIDGVTVTPNFTAQALTNLALINATSNSLTATWFDPNTGSHQISKVEAIDSSGSILATGTTSPLVISSLMPSSPYNIYIKATYTDYYTATSNAVGGNTTSDVPVILSFFSDAVLVDTLFAPITLDTSGADRWLVKVDDPVAPVITDFLSVKPTLIDLGTLGVHTLYAWAMNSFSENISQVVTWGIEAKLSTPATLESIVVAQQPGDENTADVTWSTLGDTTGFEFLITIDDNNIPAAQGPYTAPITADLTGLASGFHTAYAWIRETSTGYVSGYVTSIFQVTLSANATITMNATVASVNEETSPTYDIVFTSSLSAGAQSFNLVTSGAGAGSSFIGISKQITIPDGQTQVTETIQVVYAALTADSPVAVQLSNPVNCTLQDSLLTVTINPLSGVWAYSGDVDWNTVDPDSLPSFSGNTRSTIVADGEKFDFSADSADYDGIYLTGSETITAENCYFKNASKASVHTYQAAGHTIRNCNFSVSGRNSPGATNGAYAVYMQDGKDNVSTGNNRMLNNLFDHCSGDLLFWNEDGGSGDRAEFNFTEGPDSSNTSGNVSFILHFSNRGMPSGAIKNLHNTMYSPGQAFGGETLQNEDIITFQRSDGDAGWLECKYNRLFGGNTNSGSSTRFQVGDQDDASNSDLQWNVIVQPTHTIHGLNSGTGRNFSNNRAFASQSEPMQSGNAVGLAMQRQGSYASVGTTHSNEISNNELMLWAARSPGSTGFQFWYPSSGSDGISPNYGSGGAGSSEEHPTGWGSSRTDPGTNETGDAGHRWNGNNGLDGYNALFYRNVAYPDASKPGTLYCPNLPWLFIENCSHDTAIGTGALTYDHGAGTLTWQEYGDTVGVAVNIPAMGDMAFIPSANNVGKIKEFKTIEIIVKGVPTGSASQQIMCTAVDRYKQYFYAGPNGDGST